MPPRTRIPGQPCSFGLVLASCDTPNMTSALVNLREQYTQQWNLTVQREITSRVAFTAAYVGSRTVRLQQGQRRNDPPPGPGAIQARRPYPQWGAIGLQEWGGKGTYNALQTSLEVRDWHGLTLMGSFVRAKCLDNGTDDSGAPSMALIGLNYGPCDFDQANTSSISFNYGIPVGRGKAFLNHLPGVVDGVLGGWQVAAVTTLKSGLPFTPTIGSDRANTGAGGQRPNAIGPAFVPQTINCWYYTSANSSCKSLFPNATDTFFVPAQYTIGTSGRNILRADNLYQLDFSLLKDVRISEAKRVQFRAEFFNIMNHPVFNAPGAQYRPGIRRAGLVHTEQQSHHRICTEVLFLRSWLDDSPWTVALAPCLLFAQLDRVGPPNSNYALLKNRAAVDAGQRRFLQLCSGCHARNGEGGQGEGQGPNLVTSWEVRRAQDRELFAFIRNGVKGTAMPPFALPDDQIWELAAFVRSLNAPASAVPVAGRRGRGRGDLFRQTRLLRMPRDPGPGRVSRPRSLGHRSGSQARRDSRGDSESQGRGESGIPAGTDRSRKGTAAPRSRPARIELVPAGAGREGKPAPAPRR